MKAPTTIQYRASGDANVYTMACEGEWFARIHFTGELAAEQQEAFMQRVADAMNAPAVDQIRRQEKATQP